jgi:large subunit ribosomal protein L6
MKADILQQEVTIPEGVTVSVNKYKATISGEKGEITRRFPSKKVVMSVADGKLAFTAKKATLREKKLINTFRAHANNMMRGVQEGHTYKLKICSGHFPMNVSLKGDQFEVKNFIGESVPRLLTIKEGVSVKIEGDQIEVTGIDKEIVAQVAGGIETLTRRPGFDTRIFQDGIYLTVKDGKIIG